MRRTFFCGARERSERQRGGSVLVRMFVKVGSDFNQKVPFRPPSSRHMSYLLTHLPGVLAVAFTAILLFLTWAIWDLRQKWQRVFPKRPKGDAIGNVIERLVNVEHAVANIEPRLKIVESVSHVAIQKVGFMRFNPFEHTGGDQSFAVALLDRENSGIILSSLYTREGVRVYAKEVTNGTSKHPLSDEEQTVLREAMEEKS